MNRSAPVRAAGLAPVCVFAGLALTVDPLAAQDLSFGVGGMHTRYADSLDGAALTVSARATLPASPLHGAFEGSLSRFDAGGWAAQGGLGALWLAALGGPVRVGVAADGSASYLEGGTTSGSAAGGPVLAVGSGAWLASATATAGALRRTDGVSDRTIGGTLRLAVDRPAWSATAAVGRTDAGWARFSDASGSLEVRAAVVALAVTGGVRTGDLGDEGWVQARVAWRIAPWASLEIGAGSYPPDPTGFTRGSFAVAGVRLGVTAAGIAAEFEPIRPARTLVVQRSGADTVRAVFTVRAADGLAIAGEWNAWTPTPLAPLGAGRWLAVLPLGVGVHRFSLVDHEGRWFVPPGVLSVPDDLGGTVGLLLVGS